MNTNENITNVEEIDLNENFLNEPPMLEMDFSAESDARYEAKLKMLENIRQQVVASHPELQSEPVDQFDNTPFVPSERYRYTDISFNVRSGNSEE